MKLNIIFQRGFGLGINLGHKKSKKEESFIKIYALFYGIEKLYCLDEIPLTSEGFRILNNIENNSEKSKYISNFYIRALKKHNCLSKHLKRIESIKAEKTPDEQEKDSYLKLLSSISSYINIEQLIESLQDPSDVKLNEEGFDTMRIGTI